MTQRPAMPSGNSAEAAWDRYRRSLLEHRRQLASHPSSAHPQLLAQGQYFLQSLEAVAFNVYVAPRQQYPTLYTQSFFMPFELSWGMQNPDFLNHNGFINGAHTYRIYGNAKGNYWTTVRIFGVSGATTLLCGSLEDEAPLNPLGRSRTHGRIHAMLVSRLRTIAYAGQAGELPDIVAPLIGTGLPRSGTSFLQALLAQIRGNLVPITAHGMVPVPPPGVLSDESIRMDLVARMLEFQGLNSPAINAIHPMAPEPKMKTCCFRKPPAAH